MTEIDFGQPLPGNLEYAVSFGIPTWNTAIGYAEKNPSVLDKMITGYPRYFPQPPIQKLCKHFIEKFGKVSENCRPFPSIKEAQECASFVKSLTGYQGTVHIEVETFELENDKDEKPGFSNRVVVKVAAVLASGDDFDTVREYWKLRGECVSSRLAVLLNQLLEKSNDSSNDNKWEVQKKIVLAQKDGYNAKKQVRERIAQNHCNPFGTIKKDQILAANKLNPEKDVYLVSSGMSSIFSARRFLAHWEKRRASGLISGAADGYGNHDVPLCDTAVIFGFPFKDTQVIMKTFGTCQFYGFGNSDDIKSLQNALVANNQRILAVFIETPSNPLLNMPNLTKLRELADEHGFFIVIDDTIGGLNVDILGYADIVCTSLTKLFNGSSNVMGGSLILNPKSRLYSDALDYFSSNEFEDLLWAEDATVLEINSRDFEERTIRANENTEKLLNELILPVEGSIFKKIYYPNVSSKETFENYEAVRTTKGGYGCLFSMSFFNEQDAVTFYDSLKVFKGPSNGTNFTLACPYVHLAHHSELEEVSVFGADPNFVRVSVGLEDSRWLLETFGNAIEAIREKHFPSM